MKTPSFYSLKAFESAARHQSLTLAAEELFLTQSAISKHVQLIERHFGRELFERKGPRLVVTSEGSRFCKELGQAFSLIETACQGLSRKERCLRMKSPTTFSIRWLLEALIKYHDEQDSKLVKLESALMDTEFINFGREPYDCGIQYGNGIFPASWDCLMLLSEWLTPVCSPGLFEFRPKNGLWKINVLHASPAKHDWQLWNSKFGNHLSVVADEEQIFDTMDLAINAAVRGFGVAMVDLNMARREFEENSLTAITETAVSTGHGYYLVRPKNSPKKSLIEDLGIFLSEAIKNELPDAINNFV